MQEKTHSNAVLDLKKIPNSEQLLEYYASCSIEELIKNANNPAVLYLIIKHLSDSEKFIENKSKIIQQCNQLLNQREQLHNSLNKQPIKKQQEKTTLLNKTNAKLTETDEFWFTRICVDFFKKAFVCQGTLTFENDKKLSNYLRTLFHLSVNQADLHFLLQNHPNNNEFYLYTTDDSIIKSEYCFFLKIDISKFNQKLTKSEKPALPNLFLKNFQYYLALNTESYFTSNLSTKDNAFFSVLGSPFDLNEETLKVYHSLQLDKQEDFDRKLLLYFALKLNSTEKRFFLFSDVLNLFRAMSEILKHSNNSKVFLAFYEIISKIHETARSPFLFDELKEIIRNNFLSFIKQKNNLFSENEKDKIQAILIKDLEFTKIISKQPEYTKEFDQNNATDSFKKAIVFFKRDFWNTLLSTTEKQKLENDFKLLLDHFEKQQYLPLAKKILEINKLETKEVGEKLEFIKNNLEITKLYLECCLDSLIYNQIFKIDQSNLAILLENNIENASNLKNKLRACLKLYENSFELNNESAFSQCLELFGDKLDILQQLSEIAKDSQLHSTYTSIQVKLVSLIEKKQDSLLENEKAIVETIAENCNFSEKTNQYSIFNEKFTKAKNTLTCKSLQTTLLNNSIQSLKNFCSKNNLNIDKIDMLNTDNLPFFLTQITKLSEQVEPPKNNRGHLKYLLFRFYLQTEKYSIIATMDRKKSYHDSESLNVEQIVFNNLLEEYQKNKDLSKKLEIAKKLYLASFKKNTISLTNYLTMASLFLNSFGYNLASLKYLLELFKADLERFSNTELEVELKSLIKLHLISFYNASNGFYYYQDPDIIKSVKESIFWGEDIEKSSFSCQENFVNFEQNWLNLFALGLTPFFTKDTGQLIPIVDLKKFKNKNTFIELNKAILALLATSNKNLLTDKFTEKDLLKLYLELSIKDLYPYCQKVDLKSTTNKKLINNFKQLVNSRLMLYFSKIFPDQICLLGEYIKKCEFLLKTLVWNQQSLTSFSELISNTSKLAEAHLHASLETKLEKEKREVNKAHYEKMLSKILFFKDFFPEPIRVLLKNQQYRNIESEILLTSRIALIKSSQYQPKRKNSDKVESDLFVLVLEQALHILCQESLPVLQQEIINCLKKNTNDIDETWLCKLYAYYYIGESILIDKIEYKATTLFDKIQTALTVEESLSSTAKLQIAQEKLISLHAIKKQLSEITLNKTKQAKQLQDYLDDFLKICISDTNTLSQNDIETNVNKQILTNEKILSILIYKTLQNIFTKSEDKNTCEKAIRKLEGKWFWQ